MQAVLVLVLSVIVLARAQASYEIKITNREISLNLKEEKMVDIEAICFNESNGYTVLEFIVQNKDMIKVEPAIIMLEPINKTYTFYVEGTSPGHTEVLIALVDQSIKLKSLYMIVDVYKYVSLSVFSQVVGWIYIIFWGTAYYPQIYLNFKRKSVVGLNFDFVALNIIGYIFYGMFILGVYFAPAIQDEYFSRNPRGLIPVKINDVVYNIHGIFAISVTILQCIVYEKGNQTVSIFARLIIAFICLFFIIVMALAGFGVIHWLDSLYFCSYVKVLNTALKYLPQAYMNYKRKSTQGWSIGLVLLQLCGGVCSLWQMVLDSYNYDDWVSIFGNPTKFLVGLLNIVLPSFFIVQHYCLYRKRS
ncbi:hypothetical protein RN001_012324 [Aquatica leii]|uniref:Cystinosin n=1 Tax=Aquatica leii TaxID=1421715 RepID=A0AAN7PU78_9COLE|nr:hypothetical protein RN001_012324 [Aquatica leii]